MNGHFDNADDDAGTEIVVPEWSDFVAVAADVLAHRIRLTPASRALGGDPMTVVESLVRCFSEPANGA